MQRSLFKRALYQFSKYSARLLGLLFWRAKARDTKLLPLTGGVLLCSNHQSVFDPIFVGMFCRRRINYLARESLFRSRLFGGLIRAYDAIPIQREGLGIGGIKETLKRLKRGEVVLIFPEGTRTTDGKIQPLKAGFSTLAKRAKVPIVPVAVHGLYEVWPRGQKLPGFGKVQIQFGEAISAQVVTESSEEELVVELQNRLAESFEKAGNTRKSTP